jgi:DNA-directed RNA polymerase subunit B"
MMHWEIVDALFKEYPLVKQHTDSFNGFVNVKIHKVIEEFKEIETGREGCVLKLHKVRLEKPVITEADGSKRTIYPMEARLRNRTYASPVFIEMSFFDEGSEKDRAEVHAGDLPIMLRSDYCHLKGMSREELIKAHEDPDDPGGYFIINGSEKVLVSIEDLAPNRIIITIKESGQKKVVVGNIFSVKGGFRAKVSIERTGDGLMHLNFPSSPKNISLFVILKALGFGKDEDILKAFSERPEVKNEILLGLEGTDVEDTDSALDYLGKRVAAGQEEQYRKARAGFMLDNYLLPHIGTTPEDRIKKAYFLAKMAERCMEAAAGKREEDDKDHYANKRIKIAGNLMEDLFRYALGFLIKDIKYQIERAYARGRKLQIKTLVRPDALTDRIRFAMATGTWVGGRTGVAQLLDRTAHIAAISHLRRVNSPLSKTQPHFEARDFHPTHIFKICPNETPEGQSVGLVKNLAIGCTVASHEVAELEKELKRLGVELIQK